MPNSCQPLNKLKRVCFIFTDSDTVELISDQIPAEVEALKNQGLQDAKLIPINDGHQFLLYGGSFGGFSWEDKIWKYTVANNSWEVIGTMLEAREEHAVVPVENIKCPN